MAASRATANLVIRRKICLLKKPKANLANRVNLWNPAIRAMVWAAASKRAIRSSTEKLFSAITSIIIITRLRTAF